MEIQQITDKKYADRWDEFVLKNSQPESFLQSWAWGSFKQANKATKQQSNNLLRFIIKENNQSVAMAQFFKVALPAGKFYLNCPRGPVVRTQNSEKKIKEIFKLLIDEIEKIAKQENIVFFRVAPPVTNYEVSITNFGFVKPRILCNLVEPQNTLLLNLKKSEDEILKNMHSKTRYNLRLANRKGVTIRISKKENQNFDLDVFYDLIQQTAKRDKINVFKYDYYRNLLNISNEKIKVLQFVAEYKNLSLASIVVLFWGKTATYLYGASSNQKRNLMPNCLIQWEAIKLAKKEAYENYDFWGISHKKNHWSGITRFKKGFVSNKTGTEINYIGNFDYILNSKWYNLYRLAKMLKF